MWIFPLLILIAFEGVADVFAKQFSLDGRAFNWIFAICAYMTANIFWLFAIRRGSGLARGAVLFSIGSALIAVAIGVFFYKERMSQLEIAGIVTGLVAIVLLSIAE